MMDRTHSLSRESSPRRSKAVRVCRAAPSWHVFAEVFQMGVIVLDNGQLADRACQAGGGPVFALRSPTSRATGRSRSTIITSSPGFSWAISVAKWACAFLDGGSGHSSVSFGMSSHHYSTTSLPKFNYRRLNARSIRRKHRCFPRIASESNSPNPTALPVTATRTA